MIEVRTLGRFDVIIGGRPVTRWRAGKARNLLQYLLLRPGLVVPRDVLFEALWPTLDAPRGSLKVAIHTLRNILADVGAADAINKGGSRISILTQECGYSIETNNVWVDFQEFSSLVRQAQEDRANAPRESIAKLCAAAQLYHGDFLPGVSMPWAEPQREWLRSLALSALQRLVVSAVEDGDDLELLSYCHKILDIDSLHEETYRTLIRLYGQRGQLDQAHRWYKLCSSRMRDVLGISPNELTRMVHWQAMSGELADQITPSSPLAPIRVSLPAAQPATGPGMDR